MIVQVEKTPLVMDNPLVSVVLPVYNGEKDVGNAIRSIQAQTYAHWELVIRDDGSKDRTLEICRAYVARDRRIKVSTNGVNLGLAKTMNRLMPLATGEYIAIQEHDDFSVPERLEWEVDVLRSKPEIGLVSGIAAWVDDEGRTINHFPGLLERGEQFPLDRKAMVRFLYVEQSKVVNAACMFRRSVIEGNAEPFDEDARMSIDWQFFVHTAHCFGVYGIPKVLVYAKRGSQNLSLTRKTELRFFEARRCIRLLYEQYGKDENSPINYWLYRKAMATELVIEGRSYSRIKGLLRLLQALAYQPTKGLAWRSLLELFGRGLRRLIRKPQLGNR